jgi:hypothetical protein
MGLLILGGVVFLVGIIVSVAGLKNWRRRSRILGTPTSPIAQAPGNALVEVKGRAMPSEQGLVVGPFSGRQGVWVRVLVEELRSSGRNRYWVTMINECDGRVFMIDDGSGQMARVDPAGANVMPQRLQIATSGTFNDAAPHLQAFLASRGQTTTGLLGFNRTIRYSEELLAPMEPVYALGPSRRDAGPPINDGYRMVPSSQLVMFAAGGEEGELIVTNKTEDQLVAGLKWGLISGIGIMTVGFGIGVVGIITEIAQHL